MSVSVSVLKSVVSLPMAEDEEEDEEDDFDYI